MNVITDVVIDATYRPVVPVAAAAELVGIATQTFGATTHTVPKVTEHVVVALPIVRVKLLSCPLIAGDVPQSDTDGDTVPFKLNAPLI